MLTNVVKMMLRFQSKTLGKSTKLSKIKSENNNDPFEVHFLKTFDS